MPLSRGVLHTSTVCKSVQSAAGLNWRQMDGSVSLAGSLPIVGDVRGAMFFGFLAVTRWL